MGGGAVWHTVALYMTGCSSLPDDLPALLLRCHACIHSPLSHSRAPVQGRGYVMDTLAEIRERRDAGAFLLSSVGIG